MWDDWPYNDAYFIRRCVAIWNQRGVYASVTWEWPDGLACPEYSKSVAILEDLTHDEHTRTLIAICLLFSSICCCVAVRPFVHVQKERSERFVDVSLLHAPV